MMKLGKSIMFYLLKGDVCEPRCCWLIAASLLPLRTTPPHKPLLVVDFTFNWEGANY